MSSGGLVQLTGGKVFAHENDFSLAAKAIWREAGHYYLLGYWPAASKRELHDRRKRRAKASACARGSADRRTEKTAEIAENAEQT